MANNLEINLHQPVMDFLGPEMGEHWRARTRPAFAVTPDGGDGPVVGQLYGRPFLPADMPWPERAGYGPMSHVATIVLAALPQGVLDFDLPRDGTLLFFHWGHYEIANYQEDNEWDDNLYYFEGRSSEPGAGCRVLHIPGSTETVLRSAPHGDDSCKAGVGRPLRLLGTFASRLCWELTEVEYLLPGDGKSTALAEAFDQGQFFSYQIGGHQDPLISPSVDNAPRGDLRGPHGPQPGEDVMVMLAVFYDRNDDVYTHWFIRPEHAQQGRFDDVYYDLQN
ncbi:DUF1963 domain-containing protein [Streptomyces sp. NPDC001288]|uniref:DUF1963 domain-containing protein n=1 Tax=Streptomyces sp. NPDC001297 TaxID=3364559 RepID=UPI0036C8F352